MLNAAPLPSHPGSEKKRADPAVLRSLCTNYLPSGKVEVLMSEFESWASVKVRKPQCFVQGAAVGGGVFTCWTTANVLCRVHYCSEDSWNSMLSVCIVPFFAFFHFYAKSLLAQSLTAV